MNNLPGFELIYKKEIPKFQQFIIDNQIDVNSIEDHEGNSYLSAAIGIASLEACRFLIERGADVNKFNKKFKQTLLFRACSLRHRHIAVYFIEQGADLNCKNETGETILIFACRLGLYEVVLKLLELLSLEQIDTQDNLGFSGLLIACQYGYKHIVEALIGKGANVHLKNKYGENSLLLASDYGEKVITNMLIYRNVDCTVKSDREGKTALISACYHGQLKNAQIFIERGAQINDCDNFRRSPLSEACLSGNLELVKLLVEKGADVNNPKFRPALIWACHGKRDDIAKFLVEKGADLNAKDDCGNTALLIACKYILNESLAAYLLEKGAEFQVKNKFEQTVYVEAIKGFPFTVGVLIRNSLLLRFRKIFEENTSDILVRKLKDSIDSQKEEFIFHTDFLEVFKPIDVYIESDKLQLIQELNEKMSYFRSFEFREKFIQDILNTLKDFKEMLEIGKSKMNRIFSELEGQVQEFPKFEPMDLTFTHLIDLIQNETLIDLVHRETQTELEKCKKLRIIFYHIETFLESINERLEFANKLFDLISQKCSLLENRMK